MYFVLAKFHVVRLCAYDCSLSKLKSKLLYDWQSVSQSVNISWYRVPLWDLRPDIISCRNVAVWNLRSCIYWAPSLMRGRVCNLQCNHSIVRVAQNPKPYFTVSSETLPTWRVRFPYLYVVWLHVLQCVCAAFWCLYWVLFRISGCLVMHVIHMDSFFTNYIYIYMYDTFPMCLGVFLFFQFLWLLWLWYYKILCLHFVL
jgi:hypothetical protein